MTQWIKDAATEGVDRIATRGRHNGCKRLPRCATCQYLREQLAEIIARHQQSDARKSLGIETAERATVPVFPEDDGA